MQLFEQHKADYGILICFNFQRLPYLPTFCLSASQATVWLGSTKCKALKIIIVTAGCQSVYIHHNVPVFVYS